MLFFLCRNQFFFSLLVLFPVYKVRVFVIHTTLNLTSISVNSEWSHIIKINTPKCKNKQDNKNNENEKYTEKKDRRFHIRMSLIKIRCVC